MPDQATEAGFKIDGIVYPFPDSEFTLGEIGGIEEITGFTITEFSQQLEQSQKSKRTPPMRVVLGLLYVAMSRVEPLTTVADVKGLKLEDFDVLGGAEADPPGAGEDASETSSSTGASVESSGDERKPSPELSSIRPAPILEALA